MALLPGKGDILSRERISPLLRTLRHAGNKVQSTALPKIPPFSKERRTPRKGSYIRDLIFPERIGIVVKCGYAVFSSFPGMSIAPVSAGRN